MIVWLDAQLPPSIGPWIAQQFAVEAHAVRDLGFRDAADLTIFHAARQAGAVVMTKDADFSELVDRLGPPPQVLWVTCGNTSNIRLKEILEAGFPAIRLQLERGEPLVELAD